MYLGDGVNIASRIQALAEPNGVCISQQVFDQVRGKLDITFLELRAPRLKNLDNPIRVYSIRFAWTGKPRSWAERLADGVRFRIGNFRIVITMMVAAFFVVTTGALLERSRRPGAPRLTINKPSGGTIVGPGIECGTHGSRCSTTVTAGEPLELETHPDKDYVFSGYTGDCAPAGRTAMTAPRTCGATFDHVASAAPVVTFRLTIKKPEGGTIVGAGGILCGVNGSTCTADIPSGAPVMLKADAAEGFAWELFTGDCPSTGEMAMTAAKTCGATFIRSSAPINVGPVRAPDLSSGRQRARPTPTAPQQTASATTPQTVPVPTNPVGLPPSIPTASTTPTVPDKPAAPPISPEEHAKQEIQQLVTNYCAALSTLTPATIRSLFHFDNELESRDRYGTTSR